MHNTIIIGSGPAGHTAAIYLARANLSPLMLEGEVTDNTSPGGLLTTTKIVENYPGFPEGIDGYELAEKFKIQSEKFGTKIISEFATKISQLENGGFIVETKNNSFFTKSIIITTGSIPNKLDIPSYDIFWHKGISTCAVCDGGLPCFKCVPLAVVGGGDSACEEALHLSNTASLVYLIHRRDKFKASKIMVNRVITNKKIIIVWNSEIVEINGSEHIESIKIKNNINNSLTDLSVKGLFVAIGHSPNTKFVTDLINLDKSGYIITNSKMETSVEGIWAAGDVQDPCYRQAITAAASGCIAALEVEKWLN